MLYLILAVLCSASMAVALRLGETFSKNKFGILFGNYLTCTVTAYLMLPEKNLFFPGAEVAAAAGLVNGIIFLATLVFMQRSIGRNGAVLSAAFSKLGIMIPVLGSIFLLGERPTALQAAGMALVVAAILVINLEKGERKIASKPLLLLLLIASGSADGMSKVFEVIGERQFDALFLFYTFATALVLCGILLAVTQRQAAGLAKEAQGPAKEAQRPVKEVQRPAKEVQRPAKEAQGPAKEAQRPATSRKEENGRVRLQDLIAGIFVGIPNYFSTSLLLAAVTRLPAYLVYPCYSVGTILVVSFVSVLLLKDQMSRRQGVGCGLILAALVLLNL